jgi:hypothetical protein
VTEVWGRLSKTTSLYAGNMTSNPLDNNWWWWVKNKKIYCLFNHHCMEVQVNWVSTHGHNSFVLLCWIPRGSRCRRCGKIWGASTRHLRFDSVSEERS